jgi:CheY-like chemotaxis protein
MALVGLLEDNARIAKLCATMLHYAGHQVTIYEHPQECLQALLPARKVPESMQSLQDVLNDRSLPVEVLILDLHLPDIDGVEVLRHLQAHPRTQSLPLIFCTAAAEPEIARALSIAPRASLVEKPFKLQTLISAISAVLKPS